MEFKKNLNNDGKSIEFCEIILQNHQKVRKLAVGQISYVSDS